VFESTVASLKANPFLVSSVIHTFEGKLIAMTEVFAVSASQLIPGGRGS
jgi:hypothetical protein